MDLKKQQRKQSMQDTCRRRFLEDEQLVKQGWDERWLILQFEAYCEELGVLCCFDRSNPCIYCGSRQCRAVAGNVTLTMSMMCMYMTKESEYILQSVSNANLWYNGSRRALLTSRKARSGTPRRYLSDGEDQCWLR